MNASTKYRIAFVAEDYPPNQGGIAEFSGNLASSLAELGHEVKVVSAHVTGDSEQDRKSPVPVSRIGECDVRRKPLGLLVRRKVVAEFQRGLDGWMISQYAVDKPHFAIVSSVSVWADVCNRYSIPYAVCVHGGDAFGKRTDFVRSLYRRVVVKKILRNARCIFTNSDFTASQVIALGGVGDKVATTYCGVSPEFITQAIAIQERSRHRGDGHNLLMMCRLVPIKACDVVIKAVERLKNRFPDLMLTIAGDGPEKAELENLVNRLNISDRVRFAGYIGELSRKVELFTQSDMLVQSGRIDPHEGRPEAFGIVFAEAGICGLPAIGPRIGGVPEVIRDGKTGYLVEPDSIDSMVNAIESLLSDPYRSRKMGEAGRYWVQNMFNYSRIAGHIVDTMTGPTTNASGSSE